LTVTVTTCEPQGDEKVTLPLVFLTEIVKLAVLEPLTVAEDGETWICPLLLEAAVIVPDPLKLVM